MNPRGFHLPVFKTGALGRYASPPWERLLEVEEFSKIERLGKWQIKQGFDGDGNAIFLAWTRDALGVLGPIWMAR